MECKNATDARDVRDAVDPRDEVVIIVKSKHEAAMMKLIPVSALEGMGFMEENQNPSLYWRNKKGDYASFSGISYSKDIVHIDIYFANNEEKYLYISRKGDIIEDEDFVEDTEEIDYSGFIGPLYSENRLCFANVENVCLYIDQAEQLYYVDGKPPEMEPAMKFSKQSLLDIYSEIAKDNDISLAFLEKEFKKKTFKLKKYEKELIIYDKLQYYMDADYFYLARFGVFFCARLSDLMKSQVKELDKNAFQICAHRIKWSNDQEFRIQHSPFGLVEIESGKKYLYVHDIRSGKKLFKKKVEYFGHKLDNINTFSADEGWMVYISEDEYEECSMIMM